MTFQKSLLKIIRKSKLIKISEARLLEFHRNRLIATITRHEEKLAASGVIEKLFEENHPGHFTEFKALVASCYDLKKFRPQQVRVYRIFVGRLIKQSTRNHPKIFLEFSPEQIPEPVKDTKKTG